MKVLSIFFAITLAAQASSADPGKAAIEFLEKVRDGKINLEPGADTALSPQTAKGKRAEIAKRLERMAQDLGKDPLEIAAVKLDENFAAVLVRKVGGFDTSRLQVFPVALVKRDEGWEAAPLPASFENSGTGYAIPLRKRIEQLENWMLREQVLDLEKLRDLSKNRIRSKIEASLSEAELRKLDVRKTGERFLNACGNGDLPSLLGVLGGLGNQLPDDWSTRLKAAENAITAGATASRPWRLLVSPDVVRVVVHDEMDGDRGLISIACLDPAGSGERPAHMELLDFPLSRSADQLWRIDPPSKYLRDRVKASADEADNHDGDSADDENLPQPESIGLFAALWSAVHPAQPQPTAELSAQAWLASLNGGRFDSFLAVAQLDAASDAVKAGRLWWMVRGGSTDLALPLAFKIEESTAVGIYQFYSTRDPEKLDARAVFFEKSETGWLWKPEPSSAIRDRLMPWVSDQTKSLSESWQQKVLSSCPVIGDVNGLEAPSDEEAKICAGKWIDALNRGDVLLAISQTACLSSPRSGASALQNLGYDMTGSRANGQQPEPPILYRADPWAAAGMQFTRQGGKSSYPLYTIVKTPSGPRVLPEIDLFASDNRSRDFLNNEVLKRLAKTTSVDAEASIREVLGKFQLDISGSFKNKGQKPAK